jgi:hypothetical protein
VESRKLSGLILSRSRSMIALPLATIIF